jgi:glycolate oxidase FAD binding subunit
VAGYDLGKLFAGSFGTLGLIAEVTFRLHPRPDLSAWVTEKYHRSAAAAEAALAAAASPLQPTAVELDRPRVGGPLWVSTLLEGTPSGVSARAERMRVALGRGASEATVAPEWWGALGEAAPGPVHGTLVRVAFWAAELRRVLDAIDTVAADTGVAAAVGGSAGAGVLYASVDAGEDPEQVAMFVRALRAATGAASGGGSAPGPARGSVVVLTAPAAVQERVDLWGPVPALALMRSVKRQFDPGNLMAPGRGPGGI